MSSATPIAVLSLLVLVLLVAPASAGLHEDNNLGYKVRTPQGWEKMPIAVQERWIVARYLADKETLDKESGWGFKAEMKVILFAHAVTEDRGVKTTEDGETSTITIKNPYKNYKDYLEKNYTGGGWFVSLEEEKEAKDYKWTLMEIKVEKLAYGGKKRLVAGVFHTTDADFVVQFELLEDSYRKMRNLAYGSLKSFEFITREGSLAPATTEGAVDLTDEDEMSPEERKKHRAQRQKVTFQRAVDALPKGWTSFDRYKGFYVLSHVDRKFAMKVVKQAVGVKEWLEKTFPCMGEEYVRQAIIRICANYDEERSYFDTSGDSWLSPAREIVTHKDSGSGSMSSEFEYVNRRVFSGWFYDRDPDMASYMPDWLEQGLGQYLGTASLKGSKLAFKPDDWERERLRDAARKGELMSVRKMLLAGRAEFSFSQSSQSAALLRFLLEGPGRGMKGAKTFLEDYLTALRQVAKEKIAEEEAKEPEVREGPKTEEEEDEEFKNCGKRGEEWAAKEKTFLKEVFDRAFPEWEESDWVKLERAFENFVN